MDQLEERILQTDQLKDATKRLQHRVDPRCLCLTYMCIILSLSFAEYVQTRIK